MVPLLEISGLTFTYPGRHEPAVDDVDLVIHERMTVGLVGQSGSGKSTLARCVMGLLRPSSGSLSFEGTPMERVRAREWRGIRSRLQMVFQDPYTSLNPRLRVGAAIADPLHTFRILPRPARLSRVYELLDLVKLSPDLINRFPHQLSGGQRQRVAIARALASSPRLLVLDEPTSALDVSVGAKVLRLLTDIQDKLGTSYLFISHDLAVIRQVADEVAVMLRGKIVEGGSAESVLSSPRHPYTQALLDAVRSPIRYNSMKVQQIPREGISED
jgi:ABC-type oligopeptide transport system ATPase subunit